MVMNVSPVTTRLIGLTRQPIVQRDQKLFAYRVMAKSGTSELFGRIDSPESRGVASGLEPKTAVMSDAAISLQHLSANRPVVLTIDRDQLLNRTWMAMPSDSTILETQAPDQMDSEFIQACMGVRESGYKLILDDFIVDRRAQPLLEHIDMLNVEFPALSDDQHSRIVEAASRYGFSAIADMVDVQEDFDRAVELGYSYCQGRYYCKPRRRVPGKLQPSQVIYLQLLHEVNSPQFSMDDVELLIKQDVALTVRLLQYLNSPAFGLRTAVSSIRHALAVLGQRPLRQWLTLIAVSELSRGKPEILLITSLVRAKFCEVICKSVANDQVAAEAFLTGMLSLLDAILDQPMNEILSSLNLTESIRRSLLDRESSNGVLIDLIQSLEEADWRWMAALAFQMGLDEQLIFSSYETAVIWTTAILGHFNSTTAGSGKQPAAGV